MLVRVFYVSAAVGPQTPAVTQAILQQSRAYNSQHGITGVLLQGHGIYLQALEGEQDAVNRLYARITADPRHNRVEMVHCENIEQRRYGNWSMAHAELSDLDPMTHIEWQSFDPQSITGLLVLARIDQLLETGQMIG
jgi:hypothetical protein